MNVILPGADGKLHWTGAPDPVIDDGDVLLEVHAAALNRADLLQRDGQYPPPPGWPEWYGLEAAGIIRAMGKDVCAEGKWHVGDAVCALLGGGGYAEYVAVPSGMLMPVPKGLSMVEAAALPEAFGAAYLFLFEEAKMRAGDTVLMQAGASGLASVVIPMAKAFGARVITTVLSEEIAQELEAGHGVDIAIDCLGGDAPGRCLPYMNRGGRWVVIATLAGDLCTIDFKSMYVRGTRIIGTTLRSRTPQEKARLLAEMVERVWPKVESGEIRPTIYAALPIQQAEEAHALMRSGKHVGKIVLTVK